MSISQAYSVYTRNNRFSMTTYLILAFIIPGIICQNSKETEQLSYEKGDPVARNVKVTPMEHPVIYYQEDVIRDSYDLGNEDSSRRTDPNSQKSFSGKKEKIFFDIYPLLGEDEIKDNPVHIEVVSLSEEKKNNNTEGDSEVSEFRRSKLPKKYNRQRREAKAIHDELFKGEIIEEIPRYKRNPFIYSTPLYDNYLPQYRGVFHIPHLVIYPVKTIHHPVKGIYLNPVSPQKNADVPGKKGKPTTPKPTSVTPEIPEIGNRIDGPPVWDSSPLSTPRPPNRGSGTSKPTRRPPPPIIHEGDEDYKFPATNRNALDSANTPRTVRPQSRLTTPRTTTSPPPPPTASSIGERAVSSCIWAISACCTRNESIRYKCFERLGCNGAFWDFNPCAEDVFRSAVQVADQFLS